MWGDRLNDPDQASGVRVRQARGESERFLAVLREYQAAPEVTRERMHIEAMERVLARVEKVLIGGEVNDGIRVGASLRSASRCGSLVPASAASNNAEPI